MPNPNFARNEVWLYIICALGWFAGLYVWIFVDAHSTDGFEIAVIAALSLVVHQTYKPGGPANAR